MMRGKPSTFASGAPDGRAARTVTERRIRLNDDVRDLVAVLRPVRWLALVMLASGLVAWLI